MKFSEIKRSRFQLFGSPARNAVDIVFLTLFGILVLYLIDADRFKEFIFSAFATALLAGVAYGANFLKNRYTETKIEKSISNDSIFISLCRDEYHPKKTVAIGVTIHNYAGTSITLRNLVFTTETPGVNIKPTLYYDHQFVKRFNKKPETYATHSDPTFLMGSDVKVDDFIDIQPYTQISYGMPIHKDLDYKWWVKGNGEMKILTGCEAVVSYKKLLGGVKIVKIKTSDFMGEQLNFHLKNQLSKLEES